MTLIQLMTALIRNMLAESQTEFLHISEAHLAKPIQPATPPSSNTGKKSNDTIAQEVIDGKWGKQSRPRESTQSFNMDSY